MIGNAAPSRTAAARPPLAAQAAAKLAADVLGRGLQFALAYLSQRALGADVYGAVTLALAVGFVLSALTDFGVPVIVTREVARHPERAPRLAATGLAIKAALSLAALLPLALVALSRSVDLRLPTLLLAAALLLSSVVDYYGYVLRGLQRVDLEARLILAERVTLFGLGALALMAGAGLPGLALAYLTTSAAFAAIGHGVLRRQWGPRAAEAGTPAARALLREAAPLGAATFASIAYTRTGVFVLDALTTAGAVGALGVAQRLTEPLAIFPAAILAAVFPALSARQASAGWTQTRRLRARTIALLATAGAGLAAAGWLGAPFLIGWLYQGEYAAAGVPVQILSLALLPAFVNYALTHFLIAQGRQRLNLIFNLGVFVLNISLCLLLIPRLDVAGAALATLTSETVLLILCALALRGD